MKKKFLTLGLIAGLAVPLAACGGAAGGDSTATTSASETTTADTAATTTASSGEKRYLLTEAPDTAPTTLTMVPTLMTPTKDGALSVTG